MLLHDIKIKYDKMLLVLAGYVKQLHTQLVHTQQDLAEVKRVMNAEGKREQSEREAMEDKHRNELRVVREDHDHEREKFMKRIARMKRCVCMWVCVCVCVYVQA